MVRWGMDLTPNRGAKWVVAFWVAAPDAVLEKAHRVWDQWSADHQKTVMASGTSFPEWSPLKASSLDVGADGLLQQAFAVSVTAPGNDVEWGDRVLKDLICRLGLEHGASSSPSENVLAVGMALWDTGVDLDGSVCNLDPEPQSKGWVVWSLPASSASVSAAWMNRTEMLRAVVTAYGRGGEEEITSPSALALIGEGVLKRGREKTSHSHRAWLAHHKANALQQKLEPAVTPPKKRF